ncbi:hypothetical protein Tco_0134107 [Tanacetum coccineum]
MLSYIEQFWAMLSPKTFNDLEANSATVDSKTVVISESSVRSDLHFNDEDGITCLSNAEIFVNLALMGYERVSTKLTFQKSFFPLNGVPLYNLPFTIAEFKKSTAWNEFSTNLASHVICLAKGQKFNFSKLIFDDCLLTEPFNDIYVTPVHTKKVFTNMKRQNKDFSGRITPLFASMLVPQVVEGEGSGQPSEPQPPSSTAPPSQVTTVTTQHQNTHKPRRAKRGRDTEIPQISGPRSRPRHQDTTLGGATAQTRFETVSKKSYDLPLLEGNTSGSREDSMEYQVNLTDFVPPTRHDSPLSGGHIPGSDEDCSRLGDPTAEKESQKIGKGTKGKNPRDEALQDGTSRSKAWIRILMDLQMFSAAGPSTSTTGDIFEDEMTTIADTLVAIRSARPRTTSVVIRNVEEEPRRATPVPTVQSQDKGKGKMVEPEPTPKNPRKAQIQMDEELAQRLFEEEQAQFEREQRIARERAVEQEAKDATLIEQMEDVQARMDADEFLAARLQE